MWTSMCWKAERGGTDSPRSYPPLLQLVLASSTFCCRGLCLQQRVTVSFGSRSAARVPCPIGRKGLLPRKSLHRALARAVVPSAPARDFPRLHLKWGLKFLAGAEGSGFTIHPCICWWAFGEGVAGKLWGDDRFRYWNQMLPLVHFITVS